LRRIIIIGTLLAVFGGSAVALAASDPNTYSGSISVAKKAGSAKKPIPIGWSQTINVASSQAGYNAAPLKDIYTKIYGFTVNTKSRPTCSASKILAAKSDSSCPAGAMVASGSVQSELGSQSRQGQTTPCDPLLHVWNGGANKAVFFFVISGSHQCGGLQTGSANPYTGTFRKSGKYMVLNVPLPPDVSTNAGGLPFYASLTHEQLTWKKLTGKVKGKRVGYFSTVGCKAGKRPYSVRYTDTDGSTNYSTSQSAKAKC
jgi:hypothetical protein